MLFRVVVTGPELTGPDVPQPISGLEWEGTQGQMDGSQHHHFLTESDSAHSAGRQVLSALPAVGLWIEVVTPITAPPGWPGLNAGQQANLNAIRQRCGLTALQGELLGCVLDAGEPTWILERECKLADRAGVERALSDLARQGLVARTGEPATDPSGAAGQREDWWAITDAGWWALGLIKRPWYH